MKIYILYLCAFIASCVVAGKFGGDVACPVWVALMLLVKIEDNTSQP